MIMLYIEPSWYSFFIKVQCTNLMYWLELSALFSLPLCSGSEAWEGSGMKPIWWSEYPSWKITLHWYVLQHTKHQTIRVNVIGLSGQSRSISFLNGDDILHFMIIIILLFSHTFEVFLSIFPSFSSPWFWAGQSPSWTGIIVMMIAPNSRAWRDGGGVWRNLRGGGGECWLRGNGATQTATCCTLCKRRTVWIGQ